MATIDVFHTDPFTLIEMTAAVERNPFRPTGIGELDLFDPNPIRTNSLIVEQRAGVLALIQTSPRGAPAVERETEQRQARSFFVPRLRHGDTISASEIQGVRAMGQETETMQLQTEVARRLAGPTGLLSNLEYTYEHMRLAAIQGTLLDADGSMLYNWYNEFGITPAAEIAFDLNHVSPADGVLRIACNKVVRAVARASQGAFTTRSTVMGMCGDDFWDALVSHPDVTKTYYNWAAAAELRQGSAFQAMRFGEIDWFNYRGSDDASTIAVPHDKCKFFPRDAPGVFRVAWAPAENFTYANTLGKPQYVQPIFDTQRNEWWRQEVSSYPLYICTRPEVLLTGRQGT
jgi:predicted nucleic acid-binding Zn ribbon protein